MTNVGSWQYQRERSTLRRTRYASIPTASGTSSTLARSWSWAIVTDDPVRQEIASRYIVAALSPKALSSWCVESFHLPAHRAALALAVKMNRIGLSGGAATTRLSLSRTIVLYAAASDYQRGDRGCVGRCINARTSSGYRRGHGCTPKVIHPSNARQCADCTAPPHHSVAHHRMR